MIARERTEIMTNLMSSDERLGPRSSSNSSPTSRLTRIRRRSRRTQRTQPRNTDLTPRRAIRKQMP